MASSSNQTVALQPPLGQVSNLIDPSSFADWNVVCVTVCLISTTSVLLLRSYVRLWKKRQWIVEDYMCCLSWTLLTSFCAMSIVVMKHHGDIHEWDLRRAQVPIIIQMYNIASIVYGPAIACTKFSILLLYRRVFSPLKRGHLDRAIRLFIVILVLFYIVITFLKIFQCTPRARIWDKTEPGTCLDLGNVLTASGVFNTLTDVFLLFIPVRVSWRLNTSAKRKTGVVMLFTFGFLAPIFSIMGLTVRIKTIDSPDVTYVQPEIILWGAAEITTGLICVCIPPVAALIHSRTQIRGPMTTNLNVHSIGGSNQRRRNNDGSRRHGRVEGLEEDDDDHDLYANRDVVELQYGGAVPGVALPPPIVTTDIFTDTDSHERRAQRQKFENMRVEDSEEMLNGSTRTIGVTTTIRSERFFV